LIVDGYARADVLQEIYGFDNREFLAGLRERGFYVAEESRSNYAQTMLSLASSMNMAYLSALPERLGVDSQDRGALRAMVRESVVRESLAEQGYRMIALESSYYLTDLQTVDEYWPANLSHPALVALTPFEANLLETTLLKIVLDALVAVDSALAEGLYTAGYQGHILRTLWTFRTVPTAALRPGEAFVFAHIVAPHPPFVFGPEGEIIEQTTPFTLKDGSFFYAGRELYIQRYRDQLVFVNTELLRMVDEILASSPTEPIIILQADHGSGAYTDWDSVERTNLVERFGILNAYFFPTEAYDQLYPQITPVNSFRVVLNQFFGQDLTLLEDLTWMSLWETPYRFVDVTGASRPD
jgi:hypothetical protein